MSEARRVARPGGWIAICKWARPEDNEFFAFLIALGAGSPTGSDPMDDAVRRAQRGRRVRRRAGTDGNGG